MACASAWAERAWASCAFRSDSCWALMVVLAPPGEQAGAGAERFHLGFRLRDPGAQLVDGRAEPGGGGAGRVLLRGLLQIEVEVGDRVGRARRQLRVLGPELDGEDPRLADRIDEKPVVDVVEDAILGRKVVRVAGEAEQDEEPAQRSDAVDQRIEFRIADELQPPHGLAPEVARHDHLHLAGDRLLVDQGLVDPLLPGTRVEAFADLEEQFRLGGIAGRHEMHEQQRADQGDQRRNEDPAPALPERPPDLRQVDRFEIRMIRKPAGHGGARLAHRERTSG